MQVAIRPLAYTDITVSALASVLEGQLLNRNGTLFTGTAAVGTAANVAQGISLVDLPVRAAATPLGANQIVINAPRTLAAATKGYLAIRCQDLAAYAALTVGTTFGILAGNAVVLGTGGTTQWSLTTTNATPIIAAKQIGSDGVGYIFIEA